MDLEVRAAAPAIPEPAMAARPSPSFADILKYPDIAERFRQVRRYFFLRESTYDMTSRCNVRCDGCYYYEGDKQNAQDNVDVEAWQVLFREEKARGITFVVLAGAEPALVPALLEACHAEIPLGAIASNGLIRIPESVGYRIHVSVWGNDATSQRVRKAKRMLERQMDAYAGDAAGRLRLHLHEGKSGRNASGDRNAGQARVQSHLQHVFVDGGLPRPPGAHGRVPGRNATDHAAHAGGVSRACPVFALQRRRAHRRAFAACTCSRAPTRGKTRDSSALAARSANTVRI